MNKVIFLSLILSAGLYAQESKTLNIKITRVEPECSLFPDVSEENLKSTINEKGAKLTILSGTYKKANARRAGLNKMANIDLTLGNFMGGIPLEYNSSSRVYQYKRGNGEIVDKDMNFTRDWGSYREYDLDLIHNTITLAQINFDDSRKEARIGLCKLHFIEETAEDAYYLKKVAIYHRLHSKE